jgi:hypothetical protein
MLSVQFQESFSAAAREVTLSVGEQSWELGRMEIEATLEDSPAFTHVRYFVSGDRAEEILSAMATPGEIVVTGVVVEPSMGVSRYSTLPEAQRGDIRIVTRSTHLSHIIQSFRGCYASEQ